MLKDKHANKITTILLLTLFAISTQAIGNESETGKYVIVGFKPGLHISPDATSTVAPSAVMDQFEADVKDISRLGIRLSPLFTRPSHEINQDRAELSAQVSAANTRIPDLNRWATFQIPPGLNESDVLDYVRALPSVESAYLKPTAYPAVVSIKSGPAAATPSFTGSQGYLDDPPVGVGATYALKTKKLKGRGITVADIEGDWTPNHQDLKSTKAKNIHGVRYGTSLWYDHGTAEMGLVVGTKNKYGITGIAFKATPRMFSIFRITSEGQIADFVADAINKAAAALKPGDVIWLPIEFKDDFSGRRGFAVEYYDDTFEAIQAATAKGIIVIEAAGNGGLDLDSNIFEDGFNLKKRGDSGAIIVGAGGTGNSNLQRLSFSNYGSRVDIQNWGESVVTTGYGDLHGNSRRKSYTSSFNGTSSASGITAGVCALLQNYAKRELGRPLTPVEARNILRKTGTKQQGNIGKNIGPRPDLKKAFKSVDKLKK